MFRNFCYTSYKIINKEDYEKLVNDSSKNIRGILVGNEVCPKSNKKHQQSFIQMENKIRLNTMIKYMRKLLNIKDESFHMESCKGSIQSNIDYCTKDGDYFMIGSFKSQGRRSDLRGIMDKIKNGLTKVELMEEFPEDYNKYIKFIGEYYMVCQRKLAEKYMSDNFDKSKVELNKYQVVIYDAICKQNDREITWIYDKIGGCGKTWLSKYLIVNDSAVRYTNGRSKDIAFMYNYEPMVVFDYARKIDQWLNYEIIEDLKNGMLCSTKYVSEVKCFAPPKIVIMANFLPDKSRLSADRWNIVDIGLLRVNASEVILASSARGSTYREVPLIEDSDYDSGDEFDKLCRDNNISDGDEKLMKIRNSYEDY